jgi:hypothetical protein
MICINCNKKTDTVWVETGFSGEKEALCGVCISEHLADLETQLELWKTAHGVETGEPIPCICGTEFSASGPCLADKHTVFKPTALVERLFKSHPIYKDRNK